MPQQIFLPFHQLYGCCAGSMLEGYRCSHKGAKTTTATETLTMTLDHFCCSTAHRGGSSLCSLYRQPRHKLGLQVMGIWTETDNVFLALSGCQINPHGNQAKLPVRAVEDKLVFVSHLQITARLEYSKQYQEFNV